MKKEPTKKRDPFAALEGQEDAEEMHLQSVRFIANVINATIYSSGEDYSSALEDFFPQVQALGRLIGAQNLDEVSAFLRRRSLWH